MYDKLSGTPPKDQKKKSSQAYRKPAMHFKSVQYDADGKFLVLHHHGAEKYYKINVAIVLLFFGVTLYNYVYSP